MAAMNGKKSVSGAMTEPGPGTVMGHRINAPRPTWQAALLLALALSVPVFVLLTLADWLW